MKILLVNNYYYYRGGDCTYLFSLKKLLEEEGHEVVVFAMHHPQNHDSQYSDYFVSYINYEEELKDINIASGLKVLNRTIYSGEAKKKITRLIEKEKPDVVHIQNVHHHITPSIFYAIKKHDIPIIWTLHDYTMICPNTSFLSHGKICEKCKNNNLLWPAIERCKKESFSASTMAAIEAAIHKMMRLQDLVDVFVAPSEFLKQKFVEYGLSESKIKRVDLFTHYNREEASYPIEDFYLYVGRISKEKGIKTLINAQNDVGTSNLKIVGTGALHDELKSYAASLTNGHLIDFVGYKNRQTLSVLYMQCKFIVVPSEWYETSGLIIFEAFAYGKAVIGANIGGIPELVKDGERGLLFEPGDKDDLAAVIRYLLNNPDLAEEMGRNAREFVEKEMNPKKHYEKLMDIYQSTL